MNPITQAIKGAGGPSKVARQCGVSVQAVCFWRDGERTLPAGHCITLEKMNAGRIRCEEMLPGIDWGYLRKSTAPLLESAPGQAFRLDIQDQKVAEAMTEPQDQGDAMTVPAVKPQLKSEVV